MKDLSTSFWNSPSFQGFTCPGKLNEFTRLGGLRGDKDLGFRHEGFRIFGLSLGTAVEGLFRLRENGQGVSYRIWAGKFGLQGSPWAYQLPHV